MEGRMFKVSILLDKDRIIKEGKFPLNDIYYTVEKTYKENGFLRDFDMGDGSMVFYGVKGLDDLSGFMSAKRFLQNADWFIRYALKWTGYENERHEYTDTFVEEDILALIKWSKKLVG